MTARFVLPADVDWRIRNMDRISAWLTANGVDPRDVPLDGRVSYYRRALGYDCYERDERGRLIASGDHVLQLIRLTRLQRRWPTGPRPLPIDGNAYRVRSRNRRKK